MHLAFFKKCLGTYGLGSVKFGSLEPKLSSTKSIDVENRSSSGLFACSYKTCSELEGVSEHVGFKHTFAGHNFYLYIVQTHTQETSLNATTHRANATF